MDFLSSFTDFTTISLLYLGVLQRNIKESLLLSRTSNLITRFRNNKSQWIPLDSKFLSCRFSATFIPIRGVVCRYDSRFLDYYHCVMSSKSFFLIFISTFFIISLNERPAVLSRKTNL